MMKRNKKTYFRIILLCILTICVILAFSNFRNEKHDTNYLDTTSYIFENKNTTIGWRYMFINDIRYKRQYDYTNNCWIGEWELP